MPDAGYQIPDTRCYSHELSSPNAFIGDPDARYQTPVGVKHPIQEATKVGNDLVQDASPLLKSTPDVDDTIILIIEDNPEMRAYIRGID